MSEEKKPPTTIDDNEETLSFNINKTQLFAALIPIFFLIGLGAGYFIWGPGKTGMEFARAEGEVLTRLENIENILLRDEAAVAENPSQAETLPENPAEVTRYDIELYEDDPYLGPEDAPVTIIEFSDYTCPFCRRHNIEVLGEIMTTYEGQIRYIYKDFPRNPASIALPAAGAALCAHEQDMFWDYHDKLYLMEMELGEDAFLQYAEDLALDIDTFTECLEENRYVDRVMADYNFAADLGVRSTPTFFINGIYMVGAQPFEVFAQVIDMELAEEN
jgi:protein-disulfide isomerase